MALKLSTLVTACVAFRLAGFQYFAAPAAAERAPRSDSWRAVAVAAHLLPCLHGADESAVALFACRTACEPIPWQVDARDAAGQYVLDSGPAPADRPRDTVGANDELVFMWSDAASVAADEVAPTLAGLSPQALCAHAVSVELAGERRRVFAVRFAGRAPRSPVRYVEFEPEADVMRGARVALTFAGPTPRGLSLLAGPAAGVNLLDRLKIRATARFFGIFPLSRDEDDVQSVYEAWRVGPVRILRRERKWIRLAFGYRTPYLMTETEFYRDYVRLPVRFQLNFAPAQLLSRIEVRAALDFRNLRGWRVHVPGRPPVAFAVGDRPEQTAATLAAGVPATVLVLAGADATLALALHLGPTLQSLRQTAYYRESEAADAPEDHKGEMPGLGFSLTGWGGVDRGEHWFVAESFALPPGVDPAAFAAALSATPAVYVVALP